MGSHSQHRTKAVEPWGSPGLPFSLSVYTCNIIWSEYIVDEYTLLLLVESAYSSSSKLYHLVTYNRGNQGDAEGGMQRGRSPDCELHALLRDLCPADRGRARFPMSLLDEG